MTSALAASASRWRRASAGRRAVGWWSIGGAAVGIASLVWLAWLIDFEKLGATLRAAERRYLVVLVLAIAAEQLVRAWKWRQILYPIQPIPTGRLFGAIMAGYLANMLVPLGVSPLVRAWLVARLEHLNMSAVLATVAIERFVDGVVFTGFVAVVLTEASFPDPSGNIRFGLAVAGAGTLALFVGLLAVLAWHKHEMQAVSGRLLRLVGHLPSRVRGRAEALLRAFAEGIVWPRSPWRGAAILLASVAMKVVSISYFFWAGLAFGIVLTPIDYVFLMVFAGFSHIVAHAARVPGGFVLGSIFALGLLGVSEEVAAAMVLTVQVASMATVAAVGALALWRNGVALSDLRAPPMAEARTT